MPRCVQCDYDLAGLWKADGAEITCPECEAKWSEVIERSQTVWPGWKRYIVEVVSIPGIMALPVLGLHGWSAAGGQPFRWMGEIAWALTLTPVIVAAVTTLVLALHYWRVPRGRRPGGWTLLCAGLLASVCVQGACVVVAVSIG